MTTLDAPARRSGRHRAAIAVAPFLAIGLFDVLLLLSQGIDPLWGVAILPPILFTTALAWLAVRSGFVGGDGR